MPRDVTTRWNSTFDMLAFAVQYRSAIENITGDKSANLRKYELDEAEWNIASQLHSTLKVRANSFLEIEFHPYIDWPDIQRRNTIFLSIYTLSCNRHPHDGPY